MNEKIYFIIDTPIVKSYISYYALDAFSEHNIEDVLIDVSPLINKRAYKSVKSDLIDYSEPNIYLCKGFDMLEKMVNDNKIYFYYICLLENKMMKQYSIMVSDSEDVVSSALMKIMKQYKLSNMINQQVSLENLEFIINLFGAYGNEVSGTPLVAYGYNSKIFGVVFGGLLLPREDSTAFKIYSLFNSMMAYFENLKNNDIPRCDSLFINGLNSNIEKIILNSSLFGTAKTLDGCPRSR